MVAELLDAGLHARHSQRGAQVAFDDERDERRQQVEGGADAEEYQEYREDPAVGVERRAPRGSRPS